MTRANHSDPLRTDEPDLFGGTVARAYVPDLEHVRNRLQALLYEMRASVTWPWDSSIVSLHRERTFEYLLGLLPADEAAGWREQIDVEIVRLDATAVAAE